ncbi:MAG: hypothetical protein MRERV_22c025 [Mycoplasmataceae bacterium RV_VA103A]|nr:MAG: hypothetical protein MRERV_22c025 [Mycoplasmataceae bacterium RV_VA103A]
MLGLSFFGIGAGVATQTTGTGVENGSWILEQGFKATKNLGHGVGVIGEKMNNGSQYVNNWATNSLRKDEYRDLYFAEPYNFQAQVVEKDWVLIN